MKGDIPKFFYKYRKFCNQSLDMLEKNQIFFSKPADFNDPFDCGALENILTDFREEASSYFPIPIPIVRQKTEVEVRKALNLFNEKIGILSFSAKYNSILMWSHYADNHRGFCIGFKDYLGLSRNYFREVIYSDTRDKKIIFASFLSSSGNRLKGFEDVFTNEYILKKFVDWKYENEWRVISKVGLGNYTEACLDSIIFGLRMPSGHQNEIRELLKDRSVVFYQAVKTQDGFSLSIENVS